LSFQFGGLVAAASQLLLALLLAGAVEDYRRYVKWTVSGRAQPYFIIFPTPADNTFELAVCGLIYAGVLFATIGLIHSSRNRVLFALGCVSIVAGFLVVIQALLAN
jgi:hypothetical protein